MNGMYISRLGSFAADGIKNNHKILSVAYGVCQARLYIRSIEMLHIFNGFVISVCNRFHEQGFFLIPHFQHFYRLSCRFGCFVIIHILFIIFCQNTFFFNCKMCPQFAAQSIYNTFDKALICKNREGCIV